MKHLLILAAIIVSTAASILAQNETTTAAGSYEEAKAAIAKGNAQWSEGWAKGDASLVAAVFADDGVQLAKGGKIIKGRDAIAARQAAAMKGADPGVKVSVITLDVWVDGDLAYETGSYKYEYTVKGKAGTDEGKYVTIWKRQKDGSWKLKMDMGVPQ
jgi:uncharacterized protein (TIGR02246 family)